MISTNNWRQHSATKMLQNMEPFLRQLPIISINNISYSELIDCFTYEVRKNYSVSGYPNLGKGYSQDEAKLSGIMEAVEMSCIESLFPSEWYCPSLLSHLKTPIKDPDNYKVRLSSLLGDEKYIHFRELLVLDDYDNSMQAKSLTNGLASGQYFDDCIVHSIYELIERHVIGSSLRIKILSHQLNNEFQSFLSSIQNLGLSCNVYIRGTFANTVTIESHIIDKSLSIVPYLYGAIGFGCSGNSDIAIARAISESFQGLSVSKSMYLHSYGLGTDLTGPTNGYAKEYNDVHSSSKRIIPHILSCDTLSSTNPNFSLASFNHIHKHNELIQELQLEGINQCNYIILTDPNLPFVVVRSFIDQLSNSYCI